MLFLEMLLSSQLCLWCPA